MNMKRTLSLLVLLIMIFSVIPFYAKGGGDIEYCRGKIRLSYDNTDDIELEIGSLRFTHLDLSKESATLALTSANVDSSCGVFVNGKEAGKFKGDLNMAIDPSLLVDGTNEISLRPDTTEGYYRPALKYGAFNADDFDLTSFSLAAADGSTVKLQLVKYMAVVGDTGVTEAVTEYNNEKVSVGDGWNSATGLGGTMPELPIMLGFRFENGFNSGKTVYEIDTTLLPEGRNTIKFFNTKTGTYLERTETINVNNIAPSVVFAYGSSAFVDSTDDLTITVADSVSGVSKALVYLDDRRIISLYKQGTFDLADAEMSKGKHTVCVYTKDKAGNEQYYYSSFEYDPDVVKAPELTEGKPAAEEGAVIYGGRLVKNINLYLGGAAECGDALGCSDERLADISDMDDAFSPYQSYLIDLSDVSSDRSVINCRAETASGGKYAVFAWNYKDNKWVFMDSAGTGKACAFDLSLADADGFVSDKKARIRISPYLIGNGSDTILWHTDTQYYSTYDDLNFLYQSIAEYTVKEYKAGNICYALFTGDFVDNASTDEQANKEYAVADKMQKIIDDAGVPNGVLAGNHDVRHDQLYYDYYHKYFPTSRYVKQECFGGAINRNECHFDLISIGGYDFVILCFGYGKNADPDTIAWANSVLAAYPNRNAILATHEYINAQGALLSRNAETMFEKIAVPNENVKMILCGHSEGACSQWRSVPGSDRKVLEILHDYQFSELGSGPQHVVNNCTCDGEGFLRLMQITTSGQLVMKSYSPFYDMDGYFAPYQENYVYDLDLIKGTQAVKTQYFRVSYDIAPASESDGYDVCFAEKDGIYSNMLVLNDIKYERYKIDNSNVTYSVPYDNSYGELWYPDIEPTLSLVSDGKMPDPSVVDVYADLLPSSASALIRSSGVTGFSCEIDDTGALHLTPTTSEYNWIAVGWNPFKCDIGKAPYVYFSVRTGGPIKWGITIITSSGRRLHFSQDLYERFGYKKYSVPSDLVGPMQGYIDLSKVVSANETVRNVYFTSAVPNQEVVFDYCFLGTPKGYRAEFRSGDAVKAFDVAQNGTVDDPGKPYVPGMVFDGWYTEDGNVVEFPYTVTDDTVFEARYTPAPAYKPQCEYFVTERDMAEVIPSENIIEPDTSATETPEHGSFPWVIIIAAGVLLLAAAGYFVFKPKRK